MKMLVWTAARLFLLSFTLTFVATAAAAQIGGEGTPTPFSATTLTLSAEGAANLPPDMATLTLGVESTEATAAKAMAANAARMNRVVTALKGRRHLGTGSANLEHQPFASIRLRAGPGAPPDGLSGLQPGDGHHQ